MFREWSTEFFNFSITVPQTGVFLGSQAQLFTALNSHFIICKGQLFCTFWKQIYYKQINVPDFLFNPPMLEAGYLFSKLFTIVLLSAKLRATKVNKSYRTCPWSSHDPGGGLWLSRRGPHAFQPQVWLPMDLKQECQGKIQKQERQWSEIQALQEV